MTFQLVPWAQAVAQYPFSPKGFGGGGTGFGRGFVSGASVALEGMRRYGFVLKGDA